MEIKLDAQHDVLGMGSPLMDLICKVDHDMLKKLGLPLGQMQLVDADRSLAIREQLKGLDMETVPGGSASNTLAGVAHLGGHAAFIGALGDDEQGRLYRDMTAGCGVKGLFSTHNALSGHAITLITPDSERTFATHLGAAIFLDEHDVSKEAIIESRVLHIEGYLLEGPQQRAAVVKAMQLAREFGTLVSLDVADPGVVARNRDVLHELARQYTDILFLNEEEALAFTGAADAEAALAAVAGMVPIAVVKTGAKGSLIHAEDRRLEIPGYPAHLVNTNGAGDMYAAGFLYGLTHGYSFESAGKMGSYAAARVVEKAGARLSEPVNFEHVL